MSSTPISPNSLSTAQFHRLVVVVPDQDVDEARLSRQVWTLAYPACPKVLLVGLAASVEEEYGVIRRLTTIAAILRDPRIEVKTQVLFGRKWVQALQGVLQQTDLVLCPAEPVLGKSFNRQTLLQDELRSGLKEPIYALKGLYTPLKPKSTPWLQQLAYWLGVVAILGGFGFFEVRINHLIVSWTGQITLILVVLVELGAVWLWSSLFG
jgi:hypothetical protein